MRTTHYGTLTNRMSESAKRRDQNKRQKKRRDKLANQFGNALTFYISDDTKIRLIEICKMYKHEDIFDKMAEKPNKEGISAAYSHVISELINTFYLDQILKRENDVQNELYDIYSLTWELRLEGKNDEEIAGILNIAGYKKPIKFKSGLIKLKEKEWTEENVKKIHNTDQIINLMEKFKNDTTSG